MTVSENAGAVPPICSVYMLHEQPLRTCVDIRVLFYISIVLSMKPLSNRE